MSKHLSLGGKAGDPPLTHVPSMQESCESRARLRLSATSPTSRISRREARERKKRPEREKEDWTYGLVCGVRSLCRRFLNQLATCVKVRPVSFARFFFSSESGYLVLM